MLFSNISDQFSKLTIKIPFVIIIMASITALSAGYMGYREIETSINRSVNEKVSIVLNNQKRNLENYLSEIEHDLHQQAISSEIINATAAFNKAWKSIGKNPEQLLQKAYITDNPNKLGEKEKLDTAPENNQYNKAHLKYHPKIRAFLQERGYYDIFLFNLEGDLIYSVFKELDYATNLSKGKYKNTGLGTVFKKGLTLNTGEFSFDDFKPYSPSHGAPASFIAKAIFDGEGKRIGVVAFQMPISNINNLMKIKGQIGKTGQTFIVGSDGLMRTDSEVNPDFKLLKTRIDADILTQSNEQNIATSLDEKFNNQSSLMSVVDLKFQNTVWTLVAVQSNIERLAPLNQSRNEMLLIVGLIILTIGGIGIWVSLTITRPISKLTSVMSTIANGNLKTEVEGSERKGEIADMAKAVLVFKQNAISNVALEKQQVIDRENLTKQAKLEQQKIATSFQENIMGFINGVSTSCDSMSINAASLIEDSIQSTDQSNLAQTASQRASMNVQTVAAAAEELSSSISEIGRQVNESRTIVNDAMLGAEKTTNQVAELSNATQNIGDVISLIQSIAEQTNLLALNATIEAARAGESGKGFAVVANEVKTLASQTAKATEEIGSHISLIQNSTNETVKAISEITQTMDKVNEITGVISAAVEEQSSATTLISENIQQASSETNLVSDNMVEVTDRAQKTNNSANEMSSATSLMASQTSELNDQVDNFIKKLLTA